jgi:hypothetical protein
MRYLTVPAVGSSLASFNTCYPGCAKVRYYGIWSGSGRKQLDQARALLNIPQPDADARLVSANMPAPMTPRRDPACCPYCGIGVLIEIERIYPRRRAPP